MKRVVDMTDEELGSAEDSALNAIAAGNRQIKDGLERIRAIHLERLAREFGMTNRRSWMPTATNPKEVAMNIGDAGSAG